jgi:hypothetical protein
VGGECSVLIMDDAIQVRGGGNVSAPGFDPGGDADEVRPEHVDRVRQVGCVWDAGTESCACF